MKNSLVDLNNHLFAQLERLGEEGLSGDELALEVKRSMAMSSVAGDVIDNAALLLKAAEFKDRAESATTTLPPMIKGAQLIESKT